jgi:hypothetical protein
MKHHIGFGWVAAVCFALVPGFARANFHIMEIEQVIGGVGGDTAAQAVQLKMRLAGQNFVAGQAQLVVRDAVGANPVVLSTFPGPNPTGGACLPILLATPGMAAKTSPPISGAYTMSPIPAAYLAAGSLTFESLGGGITWWRVSWGGASYSGAQTVAAGTNDADGITSPPFAGALPSSSTTALRFTPACGSLSTNNAADYAVTAGAASLTNNAGFSFAVFAPPPIPGLPGASRYLLPALLVVGFVAFAVRRRRRAA